MSNRRLHSAGELLVGGSRVIAHVLAWPLVRRWLLHRGATDAELEAELPGDDRVLDPMRGYTRAIDITAPPEAVWPWLAQMGQGRGGLYSYDALENLVGCDIHSLDVIAEEHQHLARGDLVRSGAGDDFPCWAVTAIDPQRYLVLQGAGTPSAVAVPEPTDEIPTTGFAASTWQWVLRSVGANQTRLIVRQRVAYSRRQRLLWALVEPINYVMEQQMLAGIKARSEALAVPKNER